MKIINIIGGPGVGKSTMMAGLYFTMKRSNYSVEFVPEYAKELHYGGQLKGAEQLKIFKEQFARFERLLLSGQVEYVVTDGALLNSLIYGQKTWQPGRYLHHIRKMIDVFDHFYLFLERDPDRRYDESGREQNELEALDLDVKIWQAVGRQPIEKRGRYPAKESPQGLMNYLMKCCVL